MELGRRRAVLSCVAYLAIIRGSTERGATLVRGRVSWLVDFSCLDFRLSSQFRVGTLFHRWARRRNDRGGFPGCVSTWLRSGAGTDFCRCKARVAVVAGSHHGNRLVG